MPPSNDADRLAKALHPFLSTKLGVAELRSRGWFDFLNNDRPETTDPIVMGSAAFHYLSLEDDGVWSQQTRILAGILAFLTSRTNKRPGPGDLADLKSLLDQKPVQRAAIEGWF